jgi:hypothetical protein
VIAARDQQRRFADRRIYVAIAAYRDRDLPRTIASALDAAADPARLRFGICAQYDEDSRDDLDPWREDPRFTIDAVPHWQSQGVCWARARVQDLYDDEPYFLQVDAHMRFADGWDERCIRMLGSVDSERPVLTNYPLPFEVRSDGTEVRNEVGPARRLGLEPGRPLSDLRQRSEPVEGLSRPGRHHFVAAGHIFTVGRFCRDVPYDPQIYFHGEEITLAVRAYTHGYDLYFPNESVVWHWYDHPNRLHWQDHRRHSALDARSRRRVGRLLRGGRGMGRHGLGTRRTVAAYEQLAGLRLPGRSLPEFLPAGRRTDDRRHRGC